MLNGRRERAKNYFFNEKREERKKSRKTFRKKLRRWEGTWWKEIICQCQKAEQERDLGRMYQLVKS